MLTYEECLARLTVELSPLAPERIPFEEAPGRVLAQDVRSSVALPSFDYSAMDGYALHTEDFQGNGPWEFSVVGESRTGGALPTQLERGTACRIFTGARIPPGANAVLLQEQTEPLADKRVRILRAPSLGEAIRRRGEDLEEGAIALTKGTRLRANHVGLLAALEQNEVRVHRRPNVTILSTGDELRTVGSLARPGSVVDSNGPVLAALVRACGGVARRLPFAVDDRAAVREALKEALENADLVLTIGGVSVGDHDVVRPAMEDVGIALDFWKVAIKPGKPIAVARHGRTRILGLPGNPASAVLTFSLFGAPILRAMQGDAQPFAPKVRARLANAVKHSPGRLEFARARLRVENGEYVAEVFRGQASGSVPSVGWADAYAMLPEGTAEFSAGTFIEVLRVDDV